MNLTQNLDCYEFYPEVQNEEELGRYLIDECGALDVPEHIKDYFDYEAYGRDMFLNTTSDFAGAAISRTTGVPSRNTMTGRFQRNTRYFPIPMNPAAPFSKH
ncbi:MAG: antirestriction protein ArdA [Enterocloster bolteae]